MKMWILVLALVLPAGQVLAQDQTAVTPPVVCTPAALPTPYVPASIPAKPVMPSCIDPDTHISKCSKKVLDKYNSDVDTYNAALEVLLNQSNGYLQQLNKYMGDANVYSNCEVRRINGLMRGDG